MVRRRRFPPSELSYLLWFAWTKVNQAPRADPRNRGLGRAFNAAGFITDTEGVARPSKPLTLYRGCTPDGVLGMAWTSDPDVARWFTERWATSKDTGHFAQMVTAQIKPISCLQSSTRVMSRKSLSTLPAFSIGN